MIVGVGVGVGVRNVVGEGVGERVGLGLGAEIGAFRYPVGHLGTIPITFTTRVPLVHSKVIFPPDALAIGFVTSIVKLSIKVTSAKIRKRGPFVVFIQLLLVM